jgi:hypothetical protein
VLVLSASVDSAPYKEWLKTFFDIATQNGGPGVFWDGVSVHPYHPPQQAQGYFSPEVFEADAETVRAVMKEFGDEGEMWITEVGWPGSESLGTLESQARNLCEVFVTAKASEILPVSRYDRMCWYSFLDGNGRPPHGGMGLLDTLFAAKPSLYAAGQARDVFFGKRLNGRVMAGGGRDDSVRMYEFEDADGKKTWVCWKNGGMGGGGVEADLPVRSDTVVADSVAYDEQQGAELWAAATDGWLNLELNERPVFVSENVNLTRPDLVVDSLVLDPANPRVGMPLGIRARVTNDTGGGKTVW